MGTPPATAALTLLLVATMVTVGTGLTVSGLVELARRPGALVRAVAANVIAVPAVAVIAVEALGLDGPVAYGIVLAAAAPGGGTGILLAYHARGDLALAVGLQGALLPLGLLTVPFWAAIGPGDAEVGAAAGPQLVALLALQLVPLAAGMWLRARNPVRAERAQAISRRIADLLLVGATAYVLVTTADQLGDIPLSAYVAIAVVVAMSLAVYGLPGLGDGAARRAIAMITIVRNLSLALLVAGLADRADEVILVLVTYSLLMYGLAALALVPIRRTVPLAVSTHGPET